MKKVLKQLYNDLIKFPLYLVFHPLDGFEELKRYKKGKLYVANIFLVLLILLQILQYQNTGFIVNFNNPYEMNSLTIVTTVLVIVLLFTAGNWSITTLFDGKGKFSEIYMMVCYSMFIVIILQFPNILFSQIITTEEIGFYTMIQGFSFFYMILLIIFGLIKIHEYTLLKMILTVIFTIVAMAVLIFIGILFFNLIQQIYMFIYAIIREISIRFL